VGTKKGKAFIIKCLTIVYITLEFIVGTKKGKAFIIKCLTIVSHYEFQSYIYYSKTFYDESLPFLGAHYEFQSYLYYSKTFYDESLPLLGAHYFCSENVKEIQ
jgi:hypothetical protein